MGSAASISFIDSKGVRISIIVGLALTLVLSIAALAVSAGDKCKLGDEGPVGPTGPPGKNGAAGTPGNPPILSTSKSPESPATGTFKIDCVVTSDFTATLFATGLISFKEGAEDGILLIPLDIFKESFTIKNAQTTAQVSGFCANVDGTSLEKVTYIAVVGNVVKFQFDSGSFSAKDKMCVVQVNLLSIDKTRIFFNN